MHPRVIGGAGFIKLSDDGGLNIPEIELDSIQPHKAEAVLIAEKRLCPGGGLTIDFVYTNYLARLAGHQMILAFELAQIIIQDHQIIAAKLNFVKALDDLQIGVGQVCLKFPALD